MIYNQSSRAKWAALVLLCAAATVEAAPVASFSTSHALGAGAAAVTFDGNTALSNNWVEQGVLVGFSGSADNNGCGYAGMLCYDAPSDLGAAFSGNFLATAGTNAYISIRQANGGDFTKIEFATSSLTINPYVTPVSNVFGYWQTYNNGMLTGAGTFARPTGTILGLSDAQGFDEVRYYAFAGANQTTGFSRPIIDSILAVPEPGAAGMFAVGALVLAWARRRSMR